MLVLLTLYIVLACSYLLCLFTSTYTLESGINVSPWINVAPGKFGKKNKRSPIYTLYFYYLNSRRPVLSTDQAIPSCFYFRISWISMEQRCFYFFWPLGFLEGLRSFKHWLLQKLSMKNLDQKFKFLIKK